MIHIRRSPDPVGPYFNPATIQSTNTDLIRQRLEALRKDFNGKCAYCERTIPSSVVRPIDHFRPNRFASNRDGIASLRSYEWFKDRWENLYLCCETCNQNKGDRFFVANDRSQKQDIDQANEEEAPLLIDPCRDNPLQHIRFYESGEASPLSIYGENTIRVLGLNRIQLKEARKLRIESVLRDMNGYIQSDSPQNPYNEDRQDIYQKWCDSGTEFASAIWQVLYYRIQGSNDGSSERSLFTKTFRFVSTKVSVQAGLPHYTQQDFSSQTSNEKALTGVVWPNKIVVKNFRGLTSFTHTFEENNPWLTLLGANGAGKTALLMALALVYMGEEQANQLGLHTKDFLCIGQESGSVQITTSNETGTLTLKENDPQFYIDPPSGLGPICAYGANRLFPKPSTIPPIGAVQNAVQNHVGTLFHPHLPLRELNEWAKQLSTQNRDIVIEGLKQIASPNDHIQIEWQDEAFKVEQHGLLVDLHLLSDGYQALFTFVGDILRRLNFIKVEGNGGSSKEIFEAVAGSAQGVVLLDELEVHLHPAWRKRIKGCLAKVFPRIAFIITTHDYVIMDSMSDEELICLDWNAGACNAVTNMDARKRLRWAEGEQDIPDADNPGLMMYEIMRLKNKTSRTPDETQVLAEWIPKVMRALKEDLAQ